MNKFEETLGFIDKFCKENKLEYAVIGGIAVINYNSFRTTNDIDITIKIELEELANLGKMLVACFKPVLGDAINYFERNFVLPAVYEANGIRIDFTAGISGFDKSVISRANKVKFGSTEFSVCTIEDLILYKLFASRYQDLADVEQLIKHNNKLDKIYLIEKAKELDEFGRGDISESLKKLL